MDSTITFSINGILSSKSEPRKRQKTTHYENNRTHDQMSSHTEPTAASYSTSAPYINNREHYSSQYYEQNSHEWGHFDPRSSINYINQRKSISPRSYTSETSESIQTLKTARLSQGSSRSPPTGRFRPPPFFETVLILRQRLYKLGGKIFPSDEPPTDRNVHKIWRAVEKYKVSYSLQHYFYVASLSNRCFDLVERIHYKVSRGLLEGSREKEVNQSYFNFLYGRTEEERYRLLSLLESGEKTTKDFMKPKRMSPTSSTEEETFEQSCLKCHQIITELSHQNKEIHAKYNSLKRKYDELLKETRGDVTK